MLFILFVFSPFILYAQNDVDSLRFDQSKTLLEFSEHKRDSLINDITVYLKEIRELSYLELKQSRYKIYETKNLYNLLKLDTLTGQIEQVQWGLGSDYEGTMKINSTDLSLPNSCFELYPTGNMYQFILLDKTYGRTWHVQWGHKDSERWIRRIY